MSSEALASGFESAEGVPDIYKDLGKRAVQRRSVLGTPDQGTPERAGYTGFLAISGLSTRALDPGTGTVVLRG